MESMLERSAGVVVQCKRPLPSRENIVPRLDVEASRPPVLHRFAGANVQPVGHHDEHLVAVELLVGDPDAEVRRMGGA